MILLRHLELPACVPSCVRNMNFERFQEESRGSTPPLDEETTALVDREILGLKAGDYDHRLKAYKKSRKPDLAHYKRAISEARDRLRLLEDARAGLELELRLIDEFLAR